MKTTLHILIAIVAISMLSLSGCKRDPDPAAPNEPPQNGQMYLPKKLVYLNDANNLVTTYNYVGDNFLSEIIQQHSYGTTKYVITYDDAFKPVKHETFNDGKLWISIKFTLDEKGQVIRGDQTEYDDDIFEQVAYYLFGYDEKGQMIKQEAFDSSDNNEYTILYAYDAAGNISKILNADIDDYVGECTFDDRNGIFKSVKNVMLFEVFGGTDWERFFVQNNSLVYAQTEDGDTSKHQFSYEYNPGNFPSKVIITEDEEDPYSFTMEYDVK